VNRFGRNPEPTLAGSDRGRGAARGRRPRLTRTVKASSSNTEMYGNIRRSATGSMPHRVRIRSRAARARTRSGEDAGDRAVRPRLPVRSRADKKRPPDRAVFPRAFALRARLRLLRVVGGADRAALAHLHAGSHPHGTRGPRCGRSRSPSRSPRPSLLRNASPVDWPSEVLPVSGCPSGSCCPAVAQRKLDTTPGARKCASRKQLRMILNSDDARTCGFHGGADVVWMPSNGPGRRLRGFVLSPRG
jgi:hypothetical protein